MRARGLCVLVGLVLLVSLAAAGCSSPSAKTTATVPLPAGRLPSRISKMVCASKAQKEIAEALGVPRARVSAPTWVAHVYSCAYMYSDGSFSLSIQELSSWPQTLAYFDSVRSRSGATASLANLGQGAFSESDGSVVVRKDWKVLTVDVTGLPGQFGSPPIDAGAVASTVADVILGCWDGD